MSTLFLLLLSIGVLVLLILVLAAVVVIQRRDDQPTQIQTKLSPADENRIMTYLNDGIAEIYAGLIIMMFGIFLFSEMFWLIGAFIAVFIPLYASSKRTYTAPRLHLLDDKPAKREYTGFVAFLAITIIFGVLVLALGILVYSLIQAEILPQWIRVWFSEYAWVLAGLLPAGFFIVAGLISGATRLYGYALLSLAIFTIGLLAGVPLPFLMLLFGGIVLLIGLVILYQFVNRYPIPLER
jgi:vacuolar-type H+-ATPase subunit I/STV1